MPLKKGQVYRQHSALINSDYIQAAWLVRHMPTPGLMKIRVM